MSISYDKPTRTGLYGLGDTEIIPDLRLAPLTGYEAGMYIECRRQRSVGSAKDKMYKTLLNIRNHYDKPTIVVMDGQQLEAIYREFNESLDNKLIGCFWLSEFIAFCEDIAAGDEPRRLIKARFDANQKTFFGVGA